MKMRTYEKFDGSVWQQFETDNSLIVVTGVGRQLLAGQHLSGLLHNYIDDHISGNDHTRHFLAEGANSQVYTVGDQPLVIKESKEDGDELLPALERMDTLINAVEKHCPRWIDIPKHYGVLISKQDYSKQFMLIEKIDDGITVGDILQPGDTEMRPTQNRISDIFGNVTDDFKDEVSNRFSTLQTRMRVALMAEYMTPDTYLPDIDNNLHNVVMERLDTPIAGSHIKYWVIDQ